MTTRRQAIDEPSRKGTHQIRADPTETVSSARTSSASCKMLLFLMASGLTVIFSMLGVLNFAHASFYTYFN